MGDVVWILLQAWPASFEVALMHVGTSRHVSNFPRDQSTPLATSSKNLVTDTNQVRNATPQTPHLLWVIDHHLLGKHVVDKTLWMGTIIASCEDEQKFKSYIHLGIYWKEIKEILKDGSLHAWVLIEWVAPQKPHSQPPLPRKNINNQVKLPTVI